MFAVPLQVEGVLRIQWALEGEEDRAAAELPDEPDFQWDTVHEAKQKKGYMEELEKLVRGSMYRLVRMRSCCSIGLHSWCGHHQLLRMKPAFCCTCLMCSCIVGHGRLGKD